MQMVEMLMNNTFKKPVTIESNSLIDFSNTLSSFEQAVFGGWVLQVTQL